MPEKYDDRLLPEAKRVYGVKKLPHKFCPYCGARNEAQNENCESCGKDISWIKIPEPTVRTESLPVEKVKKPTKEKKPVSKKRVILMIVAAVIAILIVLLVVLLTSSKGSGIEFSFLGFVLACVCAGHQFPRLGIPFRGGRLQDRCILSRSASRSLRYSRATSHLQPALRPVDRLELFSRSNLRVK